MSMWFCLANPDDLAALAALAGAAALVALAAVSALADCWIFEKAILHHRNLYACRSE